MAAAKWYEAIHASKRYRLGTERKDSSGARFVYGKGVASLAKGDFVVFNDETFTPVRLINTPLTGIVAISASANTSATNYSWYMVYGSTKATNLAGLAAITTGSTDKQALAQSGTAGQAVSGVVATKSISGAWAIGVSASNKGDALLNYPSCAGASLA